MDNRSIHNERQGQQFPQIDIIRLYEIMDSIIPSSSALDQHLPIPTTDWLSQVMNYRWSSGDMVSVLSHQDIEITVQEVPGLLEDIVRDGLLRKVLDAQRNQSLYGVTYKGLAAWYADKQRIQENANRTIHLALIND